MNGGILPILLMFATLGLMLSRADARAAWLGFFGLAVAAGLMSQVPLDRSSTTAVLLGFWISLIASAALVFRPVELPDRWAIAAAINGGAWAGAFALLSQRQVGLAASLVVALLFVPGRLIVGRGLAIVCKVAASWMIAVATLAIFVSLTPTPGYQPDHME